MRYQHILAEVLAMPWAITPEYLGKLAEVLALRASGHRFTDDELAARVSAGQLRAMQHGMGSRVGAVAIMPILGVLMPRGEAMNTSGAVSVQRLAAQFDQLVADPGVAAIVLDFDSPGGSVGGVEEFAVRVLDARGKKPVVAIANALMASAAYWIGASATELVVTPSALVGSVGVYGAHQDISEALAKVGVKVTLIASDKNKILGNEFEPLSEEARAEIQKRVDGFNDLFVNAVARGRGVSAKTVRAAYGGGLVFGAAEAVKIGLADRVGTLDAAIALAAKKAGVQSRGMSAGISKPGVRAEAAETMPPDENGQCPEGWEMRDGMCHRMTDARAETMEPNENGQCEEGWEMGEDGLCHMKPPTDGAAAASDARAALRLRLAELGL